MSEKFWKKMSYLVGLLPIGALFGLIAHTANIEIKDLDLWLHLAMGKFIIQHQFVPSIDIFSYTIAGQPWVNHEWLFQIIVYQLFEMFGPDGLIKMQVVVVVVTMFLLLILGYNKEKQLTATITLLLVYLVFQQRFTIRPDIYSLLFFNIYIFVLALHIDKRWSVPVLFIVQILWSNMHGFFFFGPLFVLIGFMSEWIKRHVKLPYEWNEAGRLTDSEYKRIKIIFGMVILACLVNPLFIKGAWYPISVFFSLSGENKIFFKYIQELQKPILWENIFSGGRHAYFKVLIILSCVSFIFNRRKIDISALLFWFVFLIFSLKASRNTSFFAFAAYLVIITNMVNISYSNIIPLRFTTKRFQHLTLIIAKIFLLIWIFRYSQDISIRAYYDFDEYKLKSEFGGIAQRSFPNKAVDFLVEHEVSGNFFNDFNSGAYMLGHTYPDIKVFIDGRTEVYGGKYFKEYQQMWEKGDSKLLEEKINQFNITGALLNSVRFHIPVKILNYLYDHKDWKLVYFDYDGVVFLKDVSQNKSIIDEFNIDLSSWKTKKIDLLRLGPINVLPYQNYFRAYTLESLGFNAQAKEEALEALRVLPSYAKPYQLIGKIYAEEENYDEAFVYFRTAASMSPGNKEIKSNLALTYMKLGDYEKAIKNYLFIVKTWPNDPKAYFFLSQAYALDEKYDLSIQTLQDALRLKSGVVEDIIRIGDVMFEQENYQKAKEVYALALKTEKPTTEAYLKSAMASKSMGRDDEAKSILQKALSMDPENKELRSELESLE